MPTPGAVALQAAFGNVVIQVPGLPADTIDNSSETIAQIAAGLDAGWPSLYPTTLSTCEIAVEKAFSDRIAADWPSRCWLRALGKGVDKEMAAWVASWQLGVHQYAPSVDSIYASMLAEIAICGLSNSHTNPLPLAAANAWMQYFAQEAG